ncbi:MAG: HAMP domain-containing sensor histidine kinase [Saprospiraceae bacterium]
MKNNRNPYLAQFLMALSLIFLAVFLSIYLVTEYRKEKENIRKEVGYVFVNSIRKIEGGVLNNLVFRTKKQELPRLLNVKKDGDSITYKTIFRKEVHNIQLSSDQIEVNIDQSEKLNDINQLEGSVAMFIALRNEDSTIISSSSGPSDCPEDFFNDLETTFKENIHKANIPVQYSIIKESADSISHKIINASGSYTDVSSGDKYLVHIESFGLLIFYKILGELIFSILLFLCILMAFYFVYKALATEKKLLNLKTDLLQNITHELKTPVSTVSVALEALQDFNVREDPIKTQEYIEISKNELKRLNLLIDRVLNVSEFENNFKTTYTKKLDLRSVTLEILETLKLQFEKSQTHVQFTAEDEHYFILADKQHIEGVLYNLIDNAMKYNNKVAPQIKLEISQNQNQVSLSIWDNGIGIPPEHHKNIFQKFFRVPQGDVHNVKGHGLGLSYVQEVIKSLNGKIQFSSVPNEFSKFIIQIPRA